MSVLLLPDIFRGVGGDLIDLEGSALRAVLLDVERMKWGVCGDE